VHDAKTSSAKRSSITRPSNKQQDPKHDWVIHMGFTSEYSSVLTRKFAAEFIKAKKQFELEVAILNS